MHIYNTHSIITNTFIITYITYYNFQHYLTHIAYILLQVIHHTHYLILLRDDSQVFKGRRHCCNDIYHVLTSTTTIKLSKFLESVAPSNVAQTLSKRNIECLIGF